MSITLLRWPDTAPAAGTQKFRTEKDPKFPLLDPDIIMNEHMSGENTFSFATAKYSSFFIRTASAGRKLL